LTRTADSLPWRIATRESPLALWQANFIADELRRVCPLRSVELVLLTTQGDRNRSDSLKQIGGEGLFTREVQRAVLEGQADLAVHSLKDLPTAATAGLVLACVPPRAPRFDALVFPAGHPGDFNSLPQGARIGTGSPRRRSQLLRMRPDLQLLEIRGNIDTRLKKVDGGDFDAIILAEAGLRRLGLHERISQVLSPPVMYPAVGQAALGVECRDADTELRTVLRKLTDPRTEAEVLAERACLDRLRAGCHAPVGVLSEVSEDSLAFSAVVLSPDGKQYFQASMTGSVKEPAAIGISAAEELIRQGADAVL
jgi:hydroxymethylbilane synthase